MLLVVCHSKKDSSTFNPDSLEKRQECECDCGDSIHASCGWAADTDSLPPSGKAGPPLERRALEACASPVGSPHSRAAGLARPPSISRSRSSARAFRFLNFATIRIDGEGLGLFVWGGE